MKPGRIFAFILVLAFMLTLAGCKGSYFFSFKVEQDLENKDGAWYAVGVEDVDYNFQPGGANFQDSCFTAPKRFSGDFTMTVSFSLIADTDHKYNFGIVLTDGYFYGGEPLNTLTWDVYNSGRDNDYLVEDGNNHGGSVRYDEIIEPMPGLVCDGDNEFVLTKTGNNIQMELNDELLEDFNITYYESQWFIPTVYAYPLNGANIAYGFTLESVRVDYDGTVSDSPDQP